MSGYVELYCDLARNVPCHGLGSGVLAMVQIPAYLVSSSSKKAKSTSICYCIATVSYLMEGFSLFSLLLVPLDSRLFSQKETFSRRLM